MGGRKHQDFINRLWTKWGLTEKKLGQILINQDFGCLICGVRLVIGESTSSHSRMCVDHCHKTNVIRGIICGSCNLGLSYFKDSPEILCMAAEYLIAANKAISEGRLVRVKIFNKTKLSKEMLDAVTR